VARGNGEGFGVHGDAHGGHDGVEIEERLALAHEDDVGLRFEFGVMFTEDDENLAKDFGGSEIADQPKCGGEAEVAIDGASGLGGNADGLAICFGHEDRFDGGGGLRRRSFAHAVGRHLEQMADGGVGRGEAAENCGECDGVCFAEGVAKCGGEIGDGRDVQFLFLVESVIELIAAIFGLVHIGGEGAEVIGGFAEEILASCE